MPICIVSTVGSSVFSNASAAIRDNAKLFGKGTDVVLKDIKDAARDFPGYSIYSDMLAELRAKHDDASVRKASAELNSISRILDGVNPNPNDSLVFIATETPDGVLAARILADFCKEYFKREPEVRIVDGLQVKQGTTLRRTGLRNLVQALYGSIANKHPETYDRVFNPTGGYKAFVPYMTLIAMVEPAIRITYIFDQSEELISLARLPINLDFSRLEPWVRALQSAKSATLTEAELRTLLGVDNGNLTEHDAWSLFEAIDLGDETHYAVNGLGLIVANHFPNQLLDTVWLSEQAQKAFDGLDGKQAKTWGALIEKLRDPEWRAANLHATLKNGGKFIKQGNTDERPFYYELGEGEVLLAELTRHSDRSYDKVSSRDPSRSNYATTHKWEAES
ncbi:MAG: putative CRISPR-associated protein [Caldilineaceae bacterium]|nr:putative CRISPR-associated protein [Caldilineaceae bacterium]GIK29986.1 MAG: hypothetical protein BroJett007_31240 [Chloroflexota bacterium]